MPSKFRGIGKKIKDKKYKKADEDVYSKIYEIEKLKTRKKEFNAFISKVAEVYGNAEVSGDAEVYGNAMVYGAALAAFFLASCSAQARLQRSGVHIDTVRVDYIIRSNNLTHI